MESSSELSWVELDKCFLYSSAILFELLSEELFRTSASFELALFKMGGHVAKVTRNKKTRKMWLERSVSNLTDFCEF
jgi:aspartate carbamoyltransferase catalytic subunit